MVFRKMHRIGTVPSTTKKKKEKNRKKRRHGICKLEDAVCATSEQH